MKIAITGTIGSGKSEVSKYLRSLGYDVFDCDRENGDILDRCAYEILSYHFPDCFINKVLNKSKLADSIFNNPENKAILESIMHPMILARLIARNDDPLFAEVPLLFEADWQDYFDEILLIVCDEGVAINRLANRGYSKLEAKARIDNQMPLEEKIKKATRIIYNNGSLDDLYLEVDKYLKEVLCWETTYIKLK